MEINRNNINQIILENFAKPDKDYGQNFLVEPSICQKIVDLLDIKENERILEIGPGLGSLTHFLNQSKGNISVVDIDIRMITFLESYYGKFGIDIHESDIRKFDINPYDKIIGNLPYNITTDVILYLLLNCTKTSKLILMCQTEAFPHFFDTNGKEYGPQSILVHLMGKIERKFNVKAGSFYPVPKCSSTVFEINIDENKDKKLAKNVYFFSKTMFLNRRKTIYNNLLGLIKDKNKTIEILSECKIDVNKRPEQISPEDYVCLYKSTQKIDINI